MKRIILIVCAVLAVVSALGCSKTKSFFETHDHNGDGQVTREEYNQTFSTIDYNGDGVINNEDAGSVLSGH
ncbi:MAG: hypothetical protein ACWGOX_14560 [Desulforhopalus sp.]